MKILIQFIRYFQIIVICLLHSCVTVSPPECHKNLEINIKAVENLHHCGRVIVHDLSIFFYQLNQLHEDTFQKINDIKSIDELKCNKNDFPGIVDTESIVIISEQSRTKKITWEEDAHFLLIVPQYCYLGRKKKSRPLIFVRNCDKRFKPLSFFEKYDYITKKLSFTAGELEIKDIKSE